MSDRTDQTSSGAGMAANGSRAGVRFRGKVAIVSGAARGIGRAAAVAVALARERADVVGAEIGGSG